MRRLRTHANKPFAFAKPPHHRSSAGVATFIEILASALFLVVIALLCLDICVAVAAITINDHACRDASRAASTANSSGKALNMAKTALKMYCPDGYFISQPTLVSDGFVYNDYNCAPPLDCSPYVTVTTRCVVRIPAPLFFYGASFMSNGTAQFTQQYTFPIIQTRFTKTVSSR